MSIVSELLPVLLYLFAIGIMMATKVQAITIKTSTFMQLLTLHLLSLSSNDALLSSLADIELGETSSIYE